MSSAAHDTFKSDTEHSSATLERSSAALHVVIFGLADSSAKLTNEQVQDMMDRFQSFFDPHVDEDNVKAVRKRYGAGVVNMAAPVLGGEKIKSIVQDDAEGERVLKKVDALRVFTDDIRVSHMGRHPLLGFIAIIKHGELGLKKFEEQL